MPPRRKIEQPRQKPVILFGEGKSELGYARWLNRLARSNKMPVFILSDQLLGGDPLTLVKKVLEKLQEQRRRGRIYKMVGVMMDGDRFGEDRQKDQEALRIIENKNFHLIRQQPDHEGFLLRHFQQSKHLTPVDARQSMRELRKVWEDYDKGLNALQYEKMLSLDHLSCARAHHKGLNDFLRSIGWD